MFLAWTPPRLEYIDRRVSTFPGAGPLVAVTGGAGFIGSHAVDELVARGCRVVVLDDFSTGKRENLAQWAGDPRVEVVTANIADGLFAPLAAVTRRLGPVDRVIHLAARTAVVFSVENPLEDARVNYAGTIQVMEYARRAEVAKVVLASSAAVYGDVDEVPVREAQPTRPLSPYGIDKRASEMFLHYSSAVHGVATTALRFFNVYGPRQDPASPYSGVISIFADRARAGDELVVFGDGEQTRDFAYVSDVARAVVDSSLSAKGDGEVVNIGTGRETSVNALAALVVSLCAGRDGARSQVRHAPARAGEILRSVADISRAREALGFVPETLLEDGLRRTVGELAG
jgi:UDP-glucose 4-epimerase